MMQYPNAALAPPDEPVEVPASGYEAYDLWLGARDAQEAWEVGRV